MHKEVEKHRAIDFHRKCKRDHAGFTLKESVIIALRQAAFESGERSVSGMVERWLTEKLGGVDGVAIKVKAHLDAYNRKAAHVEEFEGKPQEYKVIDLEGMLVVEKTDY